MITTLDCRKSTCIACFVIHAENFWLCIERSSLNLTEVT